MTCIPTSNECHVENPRQWGSLNTETRCNHNGQASSAVCFLSLKHPSVCRGGGNHSDDGKAHHGIQHATIKRTKADPKGLGGI